MSVFKSLGSGLSLRTLLSTFLNPHPMFHSKNPTGLASVYTHGGSPLDTTVDRVEEQYFNEVTAREKNPDRPPQLADAWVEEALHCKATKGMKHEFVAIKVRFSTQGQEGAMWLKIERTGEPKDERSKPDDEAQAQEGYNVQGTLANSGPASNPSQIPGDLADHTSSSSLTLLDSKHTVPALDRIVLIGKSDLPKELIQEETTFQPGALKYVRALQLARSVTRHYREYKLVTANCYFYAAVVIACFRRALSKTGETDEYTIARPPPPPPKSKRSIGGRSKKDGQAPGTIKGVSCFTLNKTTFENGLWTVVEKELKELDEHREAARKEREESEANRLGKLAAETRAMEAEARAEALEREVAELRRQIAEGQSQLIVA